MSRMSTGWRRALAMAMGIAVGAVSPGWPGSSLGPDPDAGDRSWSPSKASRRLSTRHSTTTSCRDWHVDSITEPLLKFCENDFKLCPNLATSWTVSPDGLTYTLKIRQGVKFHDGTTMTVDDVVYSMNRIRDPEARLASRLDARQCRRHHGARCGDGGHHAQQGRMRCSSTLSRPPPRMWSTRHSWRPTATSTARRPSAPSALAPSSSWNGSAATTRP